MVSMKGGSDPWQMSVLVERRASTLCENRHCRLIDWLNFLYTFAVLSLTLATRMVEAFCWSVATNKEEDVMQWHS
jgi:hypothetical protein